MQLQKVNGSEFGVFSQDTNKLTNSKCLKIVRYISNSFAFVPSFVFDFFLLFVHIGSIN